MIKKRTTSVELQEMERALLKDKKFLSSIKSLVKNKTIDAQQNAKKQFLEHEVTKEIINGPEAKNESKTLGGYGNLFSFIGFDKSDSPVSNVEKMFDSEPNIFYNVKGNKIRFSIRTLTKDMFWAASPMPWASGRSWLRDIEVDISGLGRYLFLKNEGLKSRSGRALQVKQDLRQSRFSPPKKYFLEIYQNNLSKKSLIKLFSKNQKLLHFR